MIKHQAIRGTYPNKVKAIIEIYKRLKPKRGYIKRSVTNPFKEKEY